MGTTISICANIALDIKNLIHSYREKHSMAYFNQGDDGNYKAYYKPKAPPGGTSSIFFGGDDKPAENKENVKEQVKQPENQEKSRPSTADKEEEKPKEPEKAVTENARQDPIVPKANDIFKKVEYPDAEQTQGTQPQSKKNVGYRVLNPPGGKSSGPLW